MKKDRRPTSAISSQRASARSDIDPFDEDETEKKFLLSKPACFIIFGKPGSGKTTLAKSLCRKWKCQFVNSPNSIALAIELQTELGKQIILDSLKNPEWSKSTAQEILMRGEAISEELTLQILKERLTSKEVAHYGYILDDFPCTSEEYLSIDAQFEFIKKLPYNPDYIINLRIADEDLIKRRKGFRVDPLTNEVYTEERYNPPKEVEEEKADEDEDDEDDENLEEIDDEDEESLPEEEDFTDAEEEEEMTPDLIERLIPRVDDFQENMEAEIKRYNALLRRRVLNYMGNHERQKVIELNATMPKLVLFKSLVQKLDSMSVPRAMVPLRLQGGEDQLDIPEDTETDDLLRTLAASELITPGFRWRRSRWGRVCPVALYEGNFTQGSPQFAVSFLDKLYVMSSADALEKFMRNPRPFIMSPQPRNPCKMCIVGPPLSGKTTLANNIAKKYGAKVFDVDAMLAPRKEEQMAQMIEEVRAEALENAITKVTGILQQERLAAEQERIAAEQARIAAENEQEKSGDEDGEAETGEEKQGDDQADKDGEDEEGELQADDGEDDGEDDGDSEEASREGSPSDSEDIVADESHPQVIKMVEEALEEARKRDVTLSADECVEIVEEAIHDHHNEMQAMNPTGQSSGNWILDNFPQTREQFNLMVERGLLPNNLICLKDNSDGGSFLLKRWYKLQTGESTDDELREEVAAVKSETLLKSGESSETNIPEGSSNEDFESEMPPKSPERDAQRVALTNFDKNWTSLQGVIRSVSVLEPVLIDCAQEEEQLLEEAVRELESPFQYKGWEYTGMDQDEEEEDLQAEGVDDDYDDDDDDEEEEDVDVFNKEKRKPFGDTKHYCPVALKENNVLWPGSSECAAKYREKVFYFSSPDARVKFLDDTTTYLADKEPLKPPALRLIVLGAKGSGKTLIGKELAKKFGVFHISFKDRLQELIIAKTKKRIGPDYPEEEVEPDENEAEGATENDNKEADKSGKSSPKAQENEEKGKKEEADEENKLEEEEEEEEEEVEFSEIETNIRDNIMENEPLTNTTLESMIPAWWNEEPFRSTGFILEGFPRNAEEARFLADSGLYPDCVINMATEEDDVVSRLMPPLLKKWKEKRDKKLAKKQKQLDIKMKKREEEKKRRKEKRLKEITERKANRKFSKQDSQDSNEDSDEEPEDDYDDEDDEDNVEDLDEIIEAEMAEEEEEEEEEDEEETEEEATERIKTELAEKYDEETEYTSSVLEVLSEDFMIPIVEVGAGRKAKIVQFVIEKKLRPIVEHRDALFDRSQPIASPLAKKMLIQGYKQPSKFGRWCPVQLSEGNVLPPNDTLSSPLFPVVYRQHVYFFASEDNREKFILSPFKYIHQAPPKPIIPIRLAIIGPPKSGKTTLANRFAQEYGAVRMSAGEALRKVTTIQSSTALAEQIFEYLKSGEAVPDELVAHAIDISLLDMQCQMRGYILDGYPTTARQIQFLTERNIIPYKVIELKVESKEMFMRAAIDRSSPQRVLPLHDSHMITAVKLSAYINSVGPIRSWYQGQHRNLFELNGEESKWKVWNGALQETKVIIKKIQTYLERTAQEKAASIADLCVTPSQLSSRFGMFGHYCPVSFIDRGELVDCETDDTQKFAAEFRGHYYKMEGEKEIGIFLENPERYTPPQVDKKSFPPPELLPRKLTGADVKAMFPVQIEMLGYCPVTYLDGDLRYEALIPGDSELVAKYKEKIYLFASEMTRDKFMRLPEKYFSLKLPNKLPPKRDPISITGLPMLGFMEQTLEVAIRKAATAVGCVKPKFPFLSAKQSALLYMAYHLKANNPKAKEYTRTKYKKKLMQFEAQCELIQYLGRTMTRKYKEPEDRPIDFDNKLTAFMSLGGITASGNPS